MAKRILIVEDEKEIAQLYAKRLQDKGFETQLAFNGLEALDKLKTSSPDLILLDLNMPKMSGLDFYQYICDYKNNPKYPVLVLTGRAELENVFKDFNIAGFIVKPFSGNRLLSEVEIVFNKQDWEKTRGISKKITLIDDNPGSSKEIEEALKNAGYKVEHADSGVLGIELIMIDPPELVLVNLSLKDLSGDLVILRLQQIAKTKKINSLLYVQLTSAQDKSVIENYATKSGVKSMVHYSDVSEIIEAVAQEFKKTLQP